ncbi:MAG: aspartate/glutamate racemase family protein [Chloroflexota bacterium]
MKSIGFLHTSPVHISTFDSLLNETQLSWKTIHRVNEALLAEARQSGITYEIVNGVKGELSQLQATGADVIVCTCSTLGDIAEALQVGFLVPILRVDRPMAAKAVETGSPILMVATLDSTLEPTSLLLEDEAKRQRQEIEQKPLICTSAWPFFEKGDMDGYLAAIEETLRQTIVESESKPAVVLLAQASMAPVADALADLGLPVLSSPSLCVNYLIGLRQA